MILVQAQESLHAICLTGIYHERNTTALKSSKHGKDFFILGNIVPPSKPMGKQTPINDPSTRQTSHSIRHLSPIAFQVYAKTGHHHLSNRPSCFRAQSWLGGGVEASGKASEAVAARVWKG
jgi:hypothetical protein